MAQTERAVLKKLLDHYDQLGSLRELLTEELEAKETRKIQLQSRKKIDAIGRDLKELPERSALGDLFLRYKLNKYQVVFLLALLRRRLVHDNPYLKGRELLGLLFDGSYDVLRGAAFLEPNAILQSAGLLVPDVRDEDDDDDLLETPFKISDRVFRLVRSAFLARRGATIPAGRSKAQPYRSNLTYVLDLRRLSLLYRKRAAKIFRFDYWEDVGIGTSESVTSLNQQLQRYRDRIEASIKKTPKAADFPTRQLAAEFGLGEEETVVLVTLLFNELLEGSAFLDAVDLVKLVSASEEDLLRKRRFLGKRSPLVKANLVAIEEMVNDKDLTAEVYLPNWVVDRMLGPDGRQAIDADVRLDFHDYLNKLGSSDDFFEDLDASE
ncbi:MAG: hypothetical protein ACF8XB_00235 [Planctomycetota bacterium JB042]